MQIIASNLEGVANIRNGSDYTVQGQEAVIPILRATDNPRRFTCIGTGFYVSTSGIFATASHVFRDALDSTTNIMSGLLVVHFIPPTTFIMRKVSKATIHERADVAVGALETLINPQTGQPLRNKVLILTKQIPSLDAEIHTWAYPNALTTHEGTIGSVRIFPKLYSGKILEEHREGRDRIMLPGPCYRTDLGIEGGTSGGPVFDSNGHVFAINSTGIDGTEIAYVSHIQSIGGLPINQYQLENGEILENVTCASLIQKGHIVTV